MRTPPEFVQARQQRVKVHPIEWVWRSGQEEDLGAIHATGETTRIGRNSGGVHFTDAEQSRTFYPRTFLGSQ